jgi:predicted regulator of Ras-like GTPase activity (Roadblock/LC7/MglB family)
MPAIDLSILNQRQTPAFYASSLATRPAFGFAGRIFIDTDSPSTGLYRDTGAAWVQIADPGAGTTGTLQQVTTNGNTTNQGLIVTAGTLSTVPDLIYNTGNGVDWYIKNIPNGPILRLKAHGTQGGYANRRGALGWKDNNGNDADILAWDDNTTTFYKPSYFQVTQGSVLFAGASGLLSQDNANFFWDDTNNHLGINTNTPACALDVNHNGTLVAKFNNTTTTSTLLAFENAGNEQWWIGTENTNNDFLFYDATNFPTLSLRTTFKTSGQVLIGGGSTGSGKLVVESAASDNGIQIVGANAPSLRIDSAATGPTKRIGIGISTAVNNFIQGSVDRDMCIFNGSTTPSPILFGIDTGTGLSSEAVRISSSRNLLVGSSVDTGQKFQLTGDQIITSPSTSSSLKINTTNVANWGTNIEFQQSGTFFGFFGSYGSLVGTTNKDLTAYSNTGNGFRVNVNNSSTSTLIISSNGISTFANSVVITQNEGLVIAPSSGASYQNFKIGATSYSLIGIAGATNDIITGALVGDLNIRATNSQKILFSVNNGSSAAMTLSSSANLLVGTSVDSGYKLSVNGSSYLNGLIVQGGGIYGATGQFVLGGGATGSFYTFSNSATNQVYLITVRQSGAAVNSVIGMCSVYAGTAVCYNIAQDNTNPVILLTLTASGLSLQLTTGSGYGTTTWEYTVTILKN